MLASLDHVSALAQRKNRSFLPGSESPGGVLRSSGLA
jgi:hypothetical protein